ncbi:MAG: hypothetical protein M1826_002467 [Phylliscum demangeonii]|nr:MAG: hypothetical protein M1826_002467 [Phylliscum demangeonii]
MSPHKRPMAPPDVPDRNSSLAILKRRRLQHQASSRELRQKMSDASIVFGSEDYLRLEIEETRLDTDGAVLAREEAKEDLAEEMIDRPTCQQLVKQANKRIASAGDHLWDLKRRLKAKLEDAGKIALLTPDREGAFTAALLQIYKDPTVSAKRSSTQQSAMRAASIAAYGSRGEKDEESGGLWCPVLGRFCPKSSVVAGHVVPSALGGGLVDYLCGEGSGVRLHAADNCIMMHSVVERAFDQGNIVIVPVDPTERPIRRWKSVLVNPEARNQLLLPEGSGSPRTVGELDERELQFRTAHRPAARFMYFHFVIAMLRLRQYNRPQWRQTWTRLVSGRPFATPGPYLRRTMLMCLARENGDLPDKEIDHLLHQGTVFETAERLSDDDETLIATRVRALGPAAAGSDDEESDDDESDAGDSSYDTADDA